MESEYLVGLSCILEAPVGCILVCFTPARILTFYFIKSNFNIII